MRGCARLIAASFLLLLSCAALAHPEDEFCTADSGLDPALCRALAEADQEVKLDPGSGHLELSLG